MSEVIQQDLAFAQYLRCLATSKVREKPDEQSLKKYWDKMCILDKSVCELLDIPMVEGLVEGVKHG